jgi:adenosylcobinamide-GDP ribazoletransferase
MLLDSWRLSVGTLTSVPVRPPVEVDRRRAATAMLLAPLAVLPLGAAVAATVLLGTAAGLPAYVVALLAVTAVVLGNRALHVDGLADTVDGLAASFDRERSLEVMRTGTTGPAGVAAVVLVLGLQVAGLCGLLAQDATVATAVLAGAAVCVSRVALLVCCARNVPTARPSGLGAVVAGTIGRRWLVGGSVLAAVALSLVGVAAGLAWWRGPLAVVVALVAVVLLVVRAVRRLGGVTGDVLGAAIEVSLAAVLVALS